MHNHSKVLQRSTRFPLNTFCLPLKISFPGTSNSSFISCTPVSYNLLLLTIIFFLPFNFFGRFCFVLSSIDFTDYKNTQAKLMQNQYKSGSTKFWLFTLRYIQRITYSKKEKNITDS